jgi:hypothetical protein
MEKYSSSSKLPSRVHTVYGANKNHFGSVSGKNKSFKTISPEKQLFQSNIQYKKTPLSENEKMIHLKNSKNFENESMIEEKNEEIKMVRKGGNSNQKMILSSKQNLKNFEMNPSMMSEGLQNMSVTKIHNRFNKMINEFDKLDVNKSYLENGFQDMNMNFGDINQSNSQKNQMESGM